MELSPRRTVFQGRNGELLQRSHCPHSPQRGGHAGRCRNLPCPGPPSCCREEYPQPSPRGREGPGRGWLIFQALPGQKTNPGPPGNSGWRPRHRYRMFACCFSWFQSPSPATRIPENPPQGPLPGLSSTGQADLKLQGNSPAEEYYHPPGKLTNGSISSATCGSSTGSRQE